MTWFHPKMPFPQRVRLLFGSLSPSKFGDKISSFADLGCLSRIPNPQSEYVSHPGSRILDPNFFHLGSLIPDLNFFSFPGPGSRMHIKEFKYFNQKMVSQLSEIWSRFSIPDPDPGSGSWLFTYPRSRSWIPDPESRDQKGNGSLILDPGSGFATLEISRFAQAQGVVSVTDFQRALLS